MAGMTRVTLDNGTIREFDLITEAKRWIRRNPERLEGFVMLFVDLDSGRELADAMPAREFIEKAFPRGDVTRRLFKLEVDGPNFVRQQVLFRPEQAKWLRAQGNISAKLRELVDAAMKR